MARDADRSSHVYQAAVKAFHEAWDAMVEVMRLQQEGQIPMQDKGIEATMVVDVPTPPTVPVPYVVAVTIQTGPRSEVVGEEYEH